VRPDRRRAQSAPGCEWPGCDGPGTHRAPKGRGREREYWHYCLDHVRAYNSTYDYFAGLPEDAVAAFQRDAVTGHRPTWRLGVNGRTRSGPTSHRWHDPFQFIDGVGVDPTPRAETRRPVRNAERRAFEMLGLEVDAAPHEIKARFKELVKRHHPDAHGGDRASEDRLRTVIQAYHCLRGGGFC
jgi:hypothetical protein